MAEYIPPIQKLIDSFRRLPGVGNKTATRYAFAALAFTDEEAEGFADALIGIKRDVHRCPVCCGLSDSEEPCEICRDTLRDGTVVCAVEGPKDVMVMERVRTYRGKYHVLGGTLSPIDGIGPNELNIKELIERVGEGVISEVIVATNPTPQGDSTASYLSKVLEPLGVKVSRLAYGIPVGGDIEYADEVTLLRAMEGRKRLD